MNLKRFGVVPLLLLYMVFPLTFSISKMALRHIPATSFVGIRMIATGLGFLVGYLFQSKGHFKIARQDALLFFKAALFGVYLTYIPDLWALQYLSVAKSAFLFVLSPFFTAFFSYMYENESFSYKKILGLFIGLMGFIPILVAKSDPAENFQTFFSVSLPELATILCVACYAYSWIPIKKLMNEKKYSPWLINSITMLGGGFGAAITAFFCDGWYKGMHPINNYKALLWYVWLIVLVGVFCYILYTYLLKNFSTTLVSFFCFTEPFFAAFYGWIFLSEHVSSWFFISISIVSIGLYIFYQEELQAG